MGEQTPPPVAPAPVPDGPAQYEAQLPAEAIELAAVGDVNLGGRVAELIAANGADYPWRHVAPILREADLVVINLECAVSDRGQPLDKQFTFRGDPRSVPAMRAAGVDVASLANNHAADFGRDALMDTVANLHGNDIVAVGAGADDAQAWQARYVDRGGIRFGFVAATRVLPLGFRAEPDRPGVASAYDEQRLLEAVQRTRERADVVAVLIHWGVELASQPNDVQVRLGRALVDAGADIVLGHHPHVLQPVERYRGSVIAYSLGNFVFTSPSPAANVSMILHIGVMPDRSMVVAQTPVRIRAGAPEPV